MQLNPQSKSVTYAIEKIGDVELAIEQIENHALEQDEISGDIARNICSELGFIRDSLGLKQGIRRHKKWAPELNDEGDK